MLISNSQVFILLLKACGTVERQQGGKKSLDLQQLGVTGMLLLGPTVNTLSHPPPWKTPLMGCKHKDKGEGAGRTAMAEARASGLTAAHSPRSRLHGWGHPSVFSWATFHQPFPPLRSSHASQCTTMGKREKQLDGREHQCKGR